MEARESIAFSQADTLRLAAIEEGYRRAMESDPEYIELKAICDRSAALQEKYRVAARGLRKLYESALERFAEANFSGKERTWSSAFGSISLRAKKATIKAGEKPNFAAIEAISQSAVKKEFRVSELPADVVADLLKDPKKLAELGLELVPASNSVTIHSALGGKR